jgi:hypothetical protein
MCTNRDLFRRTELQNCGRVNNCSWDYGLESRIFEENQQSAIQTEIELNFGGIFQQIKVRQPIGRKDSIQNVISKSRRLDSFLYEAAQNFELFSNIQDQN